MNRKNKIITDVFYPTHGLERTLYSIKSYATFMLGGVA